MRFSPLRALTPLIVLAAAAVPAAAQAGGAATPPPYVAADAQFMTGMIGHHAQAVLISGWAPTHGASQSIVLLTERIVVGQQDEIALMPRWLADRGEPVPDAEALRHAGMDHAMRDARDARAAEQLAAAGRGPGPGIRPALPHLHDPAPSRRHRDGGPALRHARAPGRTRPPSGSPPTSTPTRRPRSTGCRRCWTPCHRAAPAPDRRTSSPLRPSFSHLSQEWSMDIVHARSASGQLDRTAALVPLVLAFGVAFSGRLRVLDQRPLRCRPRRSCRRPIRASGSRRACATPAEAAWNLRVVSTTPAVGPVRGRHQLRPRLHRQLRDPGQLQRLPGAGTSPTRPSRR